MGLNVSGLLDMGGYTRNNAFGLKTDYRALIYNVIDFLIEKKQVDVATWHRTHVFGTGGSPIRRCASGFSQS